MLEPQQQSKKELKNKKTKNKIMHLHVYGEA